MSQEGEHRFVLVGRIVKPHGLRGEVVVKVSSDNPARFEAGAQLLVGNEPESAEPMQVASSRTHHGRLLLRFEQTSTVEDAETLRDRSIFVGADSLEELAEDEFWEHELVGLTVVDTSGAVIGTLAEVIDRPAQDLWSISTPRGDVLFPAAGELIVSVDIEKGEVVIDPPVGLFE